MAVKKKVVSLPMFLVFVIFLMGAAALVWFGFFGKHNPQEVEKELSRKERELKRYQGEQKAAPTPEAYAMLQKINEKLTSDLKQLEQMVQKTNFAVPEGTVTDGLFFREQLFKTDKDIHLLALDRQAALPEALGFSDELPDAKRVPLLLRQLLAIQEIVPAFIESGASALSLVKPLDPVEHKNQDTGQVTLVELPVQIGAECDFQTLLAALIRLRNSSQAIVVRELQVKTKEEETLQVQWVASGFFIASKQE